MVHLWNNIDSHGLTEQRSRPALELVIIEGYDVETASQMVDAIQSGGGGVPGLNGCPCDSKILQ